MVPPVESIPKPLINYQKIDKEGVAESPTSNKLFRHTESYSPYKPLNCSIIKDADIKSISLLEEFNHLSVDGVDTGAAFAGCAIEKKSVLLKSESIFSQITAMETISDRLEETGDFPLYPGVMNPVRIEHLHPITLTSEESIQLHGCIQGMYDLMIEARRSYSFIKRNFHFEKREEPYWNVRLWSQYAIVIDRRKIEDLLGKGTNSRVQRVFMVELVCNFFKVTLKALHREHKGAKNGNDYDPKDLGEIPPCENLDIPLLTCVRRRYKVFQKKSDREINGTQQLLLTDLAEHGDLHRFLPSIRDFKSLYNIVQGILKGLCHLHAHNFIHQDLKPSNILIFQNERGEYIAKIADFLDSARKMEALAKIGPQTREYAHFITRYYILTLHRNEAGSDYYTSLYNIPCTVYNRLWERFQNEYIFSDSSQLEGTSMGMVLAYLYLQFRQSNPEFSFLPLETVIEGLTGYSIRKTATTFEDFKSYSEKIDQSLLSKSHEEVLSLIRKRMSLNDALDLLDKSTSLL